MKTISLPIVAALLLSACTPASETLSSAGQPVTDQQGAGEVAQDVFFARLSELCGRAFRGEVEVDRDAEGRDAGAESPFANGPIIMHVRSCTDDAVHVPLHVGEDRSRTWIVSRSEDGLRLKHDHRHEDGSEDALTQYGGDTAAVGFGAGSEERQEFPVDAFSVTLFDQEGLAASTSNVWAMEIEPGVRFTYELARPSGRLFRVAFDLEESAELPPPAWGYEGDIR